MMGGTAQDLTARIDAPVLVHAPGRDGELCLRLLQAAGHLCVRSHGVDHFFEQLGRGAAAVLIAQEALCEPLASRLCQAVAGQPPWSDLPVLLVAQREQRPSPQALAALGNVSVLNRPMSPEALASAVNAALRARERQFQVRDLLEAQAEQTRRKDEFLAMLAHELRNPLAPVRFAAQAMQQPLPPAKLSSLSALLERQVGHMAKLIDRLLDATRVTRGVIELQQHPLDLSVLARAAVDAQQTLARERQVTLLESLADGAWVNADETRMRQVIDNLLDNAIKFSLPHGMVWVAVSREGGAVRLRVSDTGEGMDAQTLPSIFEPFTQADRTLDRAKGGLGLGLALIKGLVELHGGSVAARSEGRGRGSEFTVTLPAIAAPVRADEGADGQAKSGAIQVLIAEDNVDAAETLRLLLELRGYEVLVAHTGEDAIGMARGKRLDAVVCDIGLPGCSGYEVARALRQDQAHRDTLLLAVTGYGGAEDVTAALAAGFDAHFAKPVQPAQLMARLEALA